METIENIKPLIKRISYEEDERALVLVHTTVIFSSLGQEGHWWSSNEYDDNNAYQQNVIGYRETFATHYLSLNNS